MTINARKTVTLQPESYITIRRYDIGYKVTSILVTSLHDSGNRVT